MKKILESIIEPGILKNFNYETLLNLSNEIRETIITTVNKNGGHLASNLGAVELTIALHYIFNSPEDKIIWDVGHQAYPHKLLTGRYKEFSKLRQYGGLSGFPNPNESEHDLFITGHSSTSIALAAGLSSAKEILKKSNKVIAVIGDGSMTSGLAYEAINNVGHKKNDLIIILNDNEMSISKNVGLMSDYLSRFMTTPIYNKVREEIGNVFSKFGANFGTKASELINRVEESIKILLLPQVLFEDLGLKYFGIIDGHNLKELINILKKIKDLNYPVLLHIKTVKGKGYPEAEQKPTKYHGVSPQPTHEEISNADKNDSFTNVFGNQLVELAQNNEKIVAVTAAMTDGTGLTDFAKKFPNRFFDVGIAEQFAVTFSAGLAKEGFTPVVAIYSTFIQRAYDQIVHDVALQNIPVIIALDRSGLVGEDGPTHHGVFDLSFLSHIPGLEIFIPKDAREMKDMLKLAVEIKKPVVIRYPRREAIDLIEHYEPVILGEPEVVIEDSESKILVIAAGTMVNESFQAIQLLKDKNIKCNLINIRFLKPLNAVKILDMAQKCNIIFTVEENSVIGGMGAYLNNIFIEKNINKKIINIGLPDRFVTFGAIPLLLKELKLNSEGLAERISSAI